MTLRASSNSVNYLGSFTFANLPSASSNSGAEAFASDWGVNGTKVRSNGTRWLPINGQTIIKRTTGAGVSGITNTETIIDKFQFPVGSIQAGDNIIVRVSQTKSGATDSGRVGIRQGTAGTTADTAITGTVGANSLAASSLSCELVFVLRVLSSTSIQRIGAAASGGSLALSASAQAAATTGLTDMSANSVYITVTCNSTGTTDTVGWQEMVIIHEAS